MSAKHAYPGKLFVGACLALALTSAYDNQSPPGYFGEAIPGLTVTQAQSYGRGFELFIKTWSQGEGNARNASSCLACHNTPMPGGSGIYPQTLVRIDTSIEPGDRLETIQTSSIESAQSTMGEGSERRRAPALFGLGLVEKALPRGEADGTRHGGFGAYGKVPSLTEFVSIAFADELGVSTTRDCARRTIKESYPTQCDAIVSEENLKDVANFLRFLAPPPRKARVEVTPGELIFHRIGCESCHAFRGVHADQVVSGIAWYEAPLSDFRLHKLGNTARSQVRTAPLWGLKSVGPPYLHDGSANSISAAILSHGGEADAVRARYEHLPPEQMQVLLRFLNEL